MANEFDPSALQSRLERAIESGSDEAIDSLDKSELVFYIGATLGTMEGIDAGHPTEFSGTVSRKALRAWAKEMSTTDDD